MNISLLKIKNFRNYSEHSLNFSEGNNFITGRNGAGKSNILVMCSITGAVIGTAAYTFLKMIGM